MKSIPQYIDLLEEFIPYTHPQQTDPLHVYYIVNQHAGAFRSKQVIKKIISSLAHRLDNCRLEKEKGYHSQRPVIKQERHFTHFSQHAEDLTGQIIEKAATGDTRESHLILIIGGDGTSNQVCSALIKAQADVRSRMQVLRFPLGTGNDNADGGSLDEVYDLLMGQHQTVYLPYLEIKGQGIGPFYSFNIASVGIDAYIVDLTHKMKRLVPGDTYKPMVDLGVLFYEQHVKPRPMHIQIFSKGQSLADTELTPSMVVMGTSGMRTYGGKVPILPDQDNICLVSQMNLFRKLHTKSLFLKGLHRSLSEVQFYSGDQIVLDYHSLFPLQIDGEMVWLKAEHFPLTMTLHQPTIPVIKKSSAV